MSKFLTYICALKPRTRLKTFIWFTSLLGTPIGSAIFLILGYGRWQLMSVDLLIVVVLLLFCGYGAWRKERAQNENRWPRLSANIRDQIALGLRIFHQGWMVQIHSNNTADCRTLAADIENALTTAGWSVQVQPSTEKVWPSGLAIAVGSPDPRMLALQAALKKVGLDAQMANSEDSTPHIVVGARIG